MHFLLQVNGLLYQQCQRRRNLAQHRSSLKRHLYVQAATIRTTNKMNYIAPEFLASWRSGSALFATGIKVVDGKIDCFEVSNDSRYDRLSRTCPFRIATCLQNHSQSCVRCLRAWCNLVDSCCSIHWRWCVRRRTAS